MSEAGLPIPVVPTLGRARAWVWGLLALAALWPLASASEPPRLAVVETSGGCVLSVESGAAPCACSDLPAAWRLLNGLPIPLNRSNARELTAIPGIGPARAQAIAAHGPYGAVADLVRVPGIGPKLAERIAAHAFFRGPDPACVP